MEKTLEELKQKRRSWQFQRYATPAQKRNLTRKINRITKRLYGEYYL